MLKEMTRCQPICFVRVPSPEISPQVVAGSPFGVHVAQGPPSSPKVKSPMSNPQNYNDANANVTNYNGLPNNCGELGVNKMTLNSVPSTSQSIKNKSDEVENRNRDPGNKDIQPVVGSPSQRHGKVYCMTIPPVTCRLIFGQLCKLGYLTETPGMRNISQNIVEDYFAVDSILVPEFESFMQRFASFSEQTLQRYLVNAVTVLNHTHIRCLQTFIICAFDMARDVLVTPRKIQFAKEKEDDLYNSLYQIAVDKGDEIQNMIEQTLGDSKSKLIEKVEEYDFIGKYTYMYNSFLSLVGIILVSIIEQFLCFLQKHYYKFFCFNIPFFPTL